MYLLPPCNCNECYSQSIIMNHGYTGIWFGSKTTRFQSKLITSTNGASHSRHDASRPNLPIEFTINPHVSVLNPLNNKIVIVEKRKMNECTYCGRESAAYHGDTTGNVYCDINCYKMHANIPSVPIHHVSETILDGDDVRRLNQGYNELYGPTSQFSQKPIVEQEHHLQQLREKFEAMRIELAHASKAISRNKVTISDREVIEKKAKDINHTLDKKKLSALEKAIAGFIKLNFPDDAIINMMTGSGSTYNAAEIQACVSALRMKLTI